MLYKRTATAVFFYFSTFDKIYTKCYFVLNLIYKYNMIKRIKKSIETEHKINLHRHFTMSEYLALHNTEDYNIINCASLDINRQSLVSFIDDYFLKKYTQIIDNKLAIAYGVDKGYSYFDLFEYVLNVNKLVHHSKIYFIKELGLREFYYALKNFNEVSTYKEGIFFELVYKVHKGLIKYNEVYKTIQDIIIQEAQLRRDNALLIATMTQPNMDEKAIDAVSEQSVAIVLPDLNNTYNDHLNYLNDEVKQKATQSSSILHTNSKFKSTILGYKEKKGFFGKETYLVEKAPFTGIVHGRHHASQAYFQNFMYQSLFNKKGFIFFNFGSTGVDEYIKHYAYTFNVIDEVVHVYHGTQEFYELDLNAMIRNNKIVIIQIPNTERVSDELVLEGYQDFDNLISSITIDSSSEYPYSIFLGYPDKYPQSFYSSLEKLSDLKHLGYSTLLATTDMQEDILFSYFDYLFLLTSEVSDFIVNLLQSDSKKINVRDIVSSEQDHFYFYTNGTSDGQRYTGLSFL